MDNSVANRSSAIERLRSFRWVALPAQQMPTRSRPFEGIRPRHLFSRSSGARTYGTFAGTVASSVWKASGRLSSGQ